MIINQVSLQEGDINTQFSPELRKMAHNAFMKYYMLSPTPNMGQVPVYVIAQVLSNITQTQISPVMLNEMLVVIGYKGALDRGVGCLPNFAVLSTKDEINAFLSVETSAEISRKLMSRKTMCDLISGGMHTTKDTEANIEQLTTPRMVIYNLIMRHKLQVDKPAVKTLFNHSGKLLRVPLKDFTTICNDVLSMCGVKDRLTSSVVSKLARSCGLSIAKGYAQGHSAITYIDGLYLPICEATDKGRMAREIYYNTGIPVFSIEDDFVDDNLVVFPKSKWGLQTSWYAKLKEGVLIDNSVLLLHQRAKQKEMEEIEAGVAEHSILTMIPTTIPMGEESSDKTANNKETATDPSTKFFDSEPIVVIEDETPDISTGVPIVDLSLED